MATFQVGDRVKFRAGRGYSEGVVTAIRTNADASLTLTITTKVEKTVNRMARACEWIGGPVGTAEANDATLPVGASPEQSAAT